MLRTLLFLEDETIDGIEKMNDVEKVIAGAGLELRQWVREGKMSTDSALLIASTDETIELGKDLGIATMGYINLKFPNQSYSGVEMLVESFEEVDEEFLIRVWQRHHHLPWTILETDRCIVREITLDDLDALFELYETGGVDVFTESLYEYEEEKEFQKAYIENMYRFFGYGMWLVFSKETGKLIGRAGLEHREIHEQTELELGYLIGSKFQGQGYATEVCKAILDYAKENTSFEQINCVVQKENVVSIYMAEKLGFQYEESFDLDGKIMLRFVRELA